MIQKWIGAALVLAGGGSTGFLLAASYRREERLLEQTLGLLARMEHELSCRASPVSALCALAEACMEPISALYRRLSEELNRQVLPNAAQCMAVALEGQRDLPGPVKAIHLQLAQGLGRYDLESQIRELQELQTLCRQMLSTHRANRPQRIRTYQTLGLCAGAGLAIILL